CRRNVQAHIITLSRLGFVINFEKSELKSDRQRKYFGFVFNSELQCVTIPEVRRNKLHSLVLDLSTRSYCSIKEFASIIGSLVSICPAVRYGLLYTKSFERYKCLALEKSNNDFKAKMSISPDMAEDFQWWLDVLANREQTNFILSGRFAREIFSDASLTGWGASCASERTHGWWSKADKTSLELKAAFYGLRCFASDLTNCEILLRIDNTTAISYINRFGSVKYPHLSSLAKAIWQWCEARNIWFVASYITSADNIIADEESRRRDTDTEWSLSWNAVQVIDREFGSFDIDLFASNINSKCDIFVSWFPDPESFAVDAFTLDWGKYYFECGVSDTFSAHSTRHASTSLAAHKGVSVNLIKRAAGWSGESRVFADFYNKVIIAFVTSRLHCSFLRTFVITIRVINK
ncbi:hypothetical protein ALC57_11826, partial [Trachymyrmex cornetzi]